MTTKPDRHDYRAHIPDSVTDNGMIQGRCATCKTVIYSTTTATTCHNAGEWMREINPHYYSWAEHPAEGDQGE